MLLCEDHAHLGFLQGICRQRGWRVVDLDLAPKGDGAASAYVLRRFPEHLDAVRCGDEGLGLLVAIDGDRVGPEGRAQGLARACVEEGRAPRQPADPLVLFVPTWSIDTWGLVFCRGETPGEGASVKPRARRLFQKPHRGFLAPGVPAEDAPRVWKPPHLKALLAGFLSGSTHPAHPSVDLARAELARWG